MKNSVISTRISSLYGSQPSSVVLCIHNSDIMTRINSLYGSQTSPVVLGMQNSVISTRNTSLYESQPSSAVFACKTAALGPELQDSMGPDFTYGFLLSKQQLQNQNCKSLWLPALICGFCIQNSDFWVYCSQTSPVDLWTQNSVLRRRMTLVYWSQPSSVVLCIQNSDFSIRNTSLYRSQPSFAPFACKTATLEPELQVSLGPRPYL